MSEATSSARRRPWFLLALVAVVAVIGIGVGVGFAVRNDDDDAASVNDASRIEAVQQACQDWMNDYDGARPQSDWCAGMGSWMSSQMGSGHTMGDAMWGDPDRMRNTCRQWMSSTSTTTSAASGDWCDEMVAWMQTHMNGDWDGWMMDDGTMGR